jgi:hypothetical protein
LVAKTQPLQSQDLAVNSKPSKSHFDDLDFQLAKMLINQCTSDLLGRASWKKCRQLPFPPKRHWEKCKDGMSSDAIEGEPSHIGINSIFSPSMPALNTSSKPISKSILDPDDPSYALSKSHNDPRIPLRHPKNRSHEDYWNDQEELRQWQECIEHTRNTYAIVKE